MEFDEYRDQAANYLEDLGIGYDISMDDFLFELYNKGIKPHDVNSYIATDTLAIDD